MRKSSKTTLDLKEAVLQGLNDPRAILQLSASRARALKLLPSIEISDRSGWKALSAQAIEQRKFLVLSRI
jgi:hypothetical protein